MIELTPDEVAHCRMLAEIEVGLLVPEVVEVPDGYYTRRVELDEDVECELYAYGDAEPVAVVTHSRVVSCRIPRYRREIRYTRA